MSHRSVDDLDKEYLASLERKLKQLKDPNGKKATAKAILSDLAAQKEHQLFRLISGVEQNQSSHQNAFDDNFVDVPIQPNFVQRKVAPQTCAINKQEKLRLLKHDIVQILHKEVETELKESQNGELRKEDEKELLEARDLLEKTLLEDSKDTNKEEEK